MLTGLGGQSCPRARDIKVDGCEAPIRAATGVPSGSGAHACHGVSQRSLTVAALSGSMVYARILAIGGPLGKSPHFYVAHSASGACQTDGLLAGYNSVGVSELALARKAKSRTVTYGPSDEFVLRLAVKIMVTLPNLPSCAALDKCHSA